MEKIVSIVKPKHDFWSLSSSLKSKVSLTDKELRKARESFGKHWPQTHTGDVLTFDQSLQKKAS